MPERKLTTSIYGYSPAMTRVSRPKAPKSRFGPPLELPEIVIEYVDTMTKTVSYTLHVKNGQSEYRTADGRPTTFAEIARRETART